MRAKIQAGFSLMEMMVVLLIVAIVAAASAPMVSKKMSRNAGSGDSPWVFTGFGNSIAYNMGGANNSSAIIGASSYTPNGGPENPRLVLASGNSDTSSLVFADAGGNYQSHISFNPTSGVVALSNVTPGNNTVTIGTNQTIQADSGLTTNNAVGIGDEIIIKSMNTTAVGQEAWALSQGASSLGSNAYARDLYSIALGYKADAQGKLGIALGYKSKTGKTVPMQVEGAIAIGAEADADSKFSTAIGYKAKVSKDAEAGIAIGKGATAGYENSIAIGAGVSTGAKNEIVLGDANSTVYIPGNLVVGKDTVLGYSESGSQVFLRETTYNKDIVRFSYAEQSSGAMRAQESGATTVGRFGLNYASSDRRLKNVGKEYTAGLEQLKQLEFYHYTFKKDEAKTPRVGVMAQDLQKVFPDAVAKGDDGYLRIRFEDMFYAVINAVKELDTKIASIVNDITPINKKLDKQQKVIESQAELIKELQKQNADFEKRLNKLERANRGK